MNKITILIAVIISTITLTRCSYIKNQNTQTEHSKISTNNSNNSSKNILSIDYIIGEWQSIEDDYPGTIEIKSTDNENEVYLIVNDDSEIRLVLNEVDSDDRLIFINSDGNLKYVLCIYEDNKLLFYKSTVDKKSEGTSRPWILEREI